MSCHGAKESIYYTLNTHVIVYTYAILFGSGYFLQALKKPTLFYS